MTERNPNPEEARDLSLDSVRSPDPGELRSRAEQNAKVLAPGGIDPLSPEESRPNPAAGEF